jgi:hypothetical protein
MKDVSILFTLAYLDLNSYLTMFNPEVLHAESDRRPAEEVARDCGLNHSGKLDKLYEQAAEFLDIEPWPWREVEYLTELEFNNLESTRTWFNRMLGITKQADRGFQS